MLLACAGTAHARPVSYEGGVTAMVSASAKETSSLLHYTFNPKTSVGVRTILRDGWRSSIHAVEINHLLWRDNGEDHQANFYLRGGVGVANIDSTGDRQAIGAAAYAGMSADWENRRWYVSYANGFETISGYPSDFSQSARVGIAPYIGESGDLHTWLMLEVRHDPSDDAGEFSLKPLVRFFKGVHLIELGVTSNREFEVSWIGRF